MRIKKNPFQLFLSDLKIEQKNNCNNQSFKDIITELIITSNKIFSDPKQIIIIPSTSPLIVNNLNLNTRTVKRNTKKTLIIKTLSPRNFENNKQYLIERNDNSNDKYSNSNKSNNNKNNNNSNSNINSDSDDNNKENENSFIPMGGKYLKSNPSNNSKNVSQELPMKNHIIIKKNVKIINPGKFKINTSRDYLIRKIIEIFLNHPTQKKIKNKKTNQIINILENDKRRTSGIISILRGIGLIGSIEAPLIETRSQEFFLAFPLPILKHGISKENYIYFRKFALNILSEPLKYLEYHNLLIQSKEILKNRLIQVINNLHSSTKFFNFKKKLELFSQKIINN
ncbi:mortality factor 4-like protein [Anaeramoeba flamelloides]|uniref:Mortality factor 4-like protein n=1 Tax=Anaeramoeba flamelloides TaxID=1746091 RepID=A0AAV7ZV61_9EUKA|nr:mortality factor 4-like protein [Anaeramoeba flamelloides]